MDHVLWLGKVAVGRVGFWEGGAAQALFADAPEATPAGPPTCPYHPTFHSCSALATDLAVMEVAAHGVLFFFGLVHHIEIYNGDNVDAKSEIHLAISGVAPLVRPTALWHLLKTVSTWQLPKCLKAWAWSITCPCDCKVCPLCISVCFLFF